jgi:hypothetical protein
VSTTQLQRAMLWAFLATLLALIGVTTVAWIRRPKTPPARTAATRRPPVPILANETDGSVYDLNLRILELQEQLSQSESLVVTQQKHLETMQRERETVTRRLDQLAGEVKELRTRFEASRSATASAAEQPGDTPEGTSPSAPPGGAVPTITPPAPAAPP